MYTMCVLFCLYLFIALGHRGRAFLDICILYMNYYYYYYYYFFLGGGGGKQILLRATIVVLQHRRNISFSFCTVKISQ